MLGRLANVPKEISAALVSYTLAGLRVFPVYEINNDRCSCGKDCGPKDAGKHPRIANWQTEATNDLRKAFRWWERWPNANIGVVTGETVNGFVIDIDNEQAWNSLGHEDVETFRYVTPRGGRHLWFDYPTDQVITNSSGSLPQGIDVRGTGGYVLMPPSRTLKGSYRDVQEFPRAHAPAWLLDALRTPEISRGALVEEKGLKSFGDFDDETQARYKRYVQGVIDSEIEALKELTEYEDLQWNNTTYGAACNLFELAKAPWSPLMRDEVEDLIRANVPPFDNEGWNQLGLDKLLDSAYKKIFHNSGVRPYPKGDNRPTTTQSNRNKKNGNTWESAKDEVERKLKFTPISTIKTESVEWLWKHRIPTGEITLLAGREGIGKSVIASWLTAQVTRGTLEGKHTGTPKSVVYLATEDSWSKTIVPRMQVTGCDMERVFKVELVNDPVSGLVLPKDIAQLREGIEEYNVGMIALDPFLSFVDMKLDSQKTRAARQALEPLANMAHETGCAIVGLIHFTKSDTQNILDKIAESKAFTQVCRQVMVVSKHPVKEDGSWGLISVGKANLAPGDVPTLEYQITGAAIQTDDGKQSMVGRVTMHGETRVSALTTIQQESDPKAYETKDCVEWLNEVILERKAVMFNALESEAKSAGYSKYLLRKAKDQLGISTFKLGGTGVGWAWYLDVTEDEAKAILKVSDASKSKEERRNLKSNLEF